MVMTASASGSSAEGRHTVTASRTASASNAGRRRSSRAASASEPPMTNDGVGGLDPMHRSRIDHLGKESELVKADAKQLGGRRVGV
jgi:hypothetical protein